MSAREADFRKLYVDRRIRHQAEYYEDRAKEYRQAHRQAVWTRNVLLLLAAIAGALGQFFDGGGRAACAVAAAVFGALAVAVTAYDALIGFPQLEKLYRDAGHNLAEAGIDWDEPDVDLAKEVERVEFIFRSERGQWGQLIVKSSRATEQDEDDDAGDGDQPAG